MAKKKATSRKASPAKQDEPFFRPFSKLAKERKSGRASSAAGPRSAPPSTKRPPAARASRPPPPPAPEPESFAAHMVGVRELEQRASRIPKTANQVERAARGSVVAEDRDAPARVRLAALVTEGLRFEVADDGERIEGRRLEVDPRELGRLRRSRYAIDARLDLHGMTAGEARAAVEAFVRKRRTAGDRVVLCVHGKGAHSPRGIGVLRGEIAAWLSQGQAARDVAAFASAPDDEGGTGALLVLLAR